jgi:hypothetical protein
MESLDNDHPAAPQTPTHLLDCLLVASSLASAWTARSVDERDQVPSIGAEVPSRDLGVHGFKV